MLLLLVFIFFVLCFLLGMTWMRIGLFNLSGKKLEGWIRKVTHTPFKGMLAGILMTGMLQSSSAVMIITVGFVSARLLMFPQTIGIVLGTNIGTTITLEFISFHFTDIILPFFIIGSICLVFKKAKIKSIGFIFIGFSCIFAAMEGFERLAIPLTNSLIGKSILLLLDRQLFYAFIFGIVLTAIIQSSTVVTGMAMSFLSAGVFPLEIGIAMMLGSNIGTCTTALLASIGAGEEARLTAYAHVWLNIGGAILCLPFISQLAEISSMLSQYPDVQLAHASVLFNIASSLLVLPFAVKFGHFIIWLHGKKTSIP